MKNADFISINFAHTPETDRFLDENAFSEIKAGAIVVNTVPMETTDLVALKNRLKRDFLPLNARIVDITGEGIYFEKYDINSWTDQLHVDNITAGVNAPAIIMGL